MKVINFYYEVTYNHKKQDKYIYQTGLARPNFLLLNFVLFLVIINYIKCNLEITLL